jgi:adenylylsulfate kinase
MSGAVMWFTGLPSSGKTTLARDVRQALGRRPSVLLDSDEIRAALSPPTGFSETARAHFYRTLAQLAALLAGQGVVVLVAATANRRSYRALARRLAPRFVEVFVDTPLDEVRRRNTKGLYGRARKLPGVGVPYERPLRPAVRAVGGSSRAAVHACLAALNRG